MPPILVYTIKKQPRTGKYALRDSKATLIGVFDTHAEAERYADDYEPFKGAVMASKKKAYRVHLSGNRYKYFDTVEAARPFLNDVFQKRNIVLTITRTPGVPHPLGTPSILRGGMRGPEGGPEKSAPIPMLRSTDPWQRTVDNVKKEGQRKGSRYTAPFRVDKWEERDRLSIVLYDAKDTVVAEWWDDEARQMFEDGFFEARKLDASVIGYAREMGWL